MVIMNEKCLNQNTTSYEAHEIPKMDRDRERKREQEGSKSYYLHS